MHLLFAPNVRAGGGGVLLQALLSAWSGKPPVSAVLDERARTTIKVPQGMQVRWTRPTLAGRLVEEWRLRKAVRQSTDVLCFHGTPPLFVSKRFKSHVKLFIQNRLLVQSSSALWSFSIKDHLRLRIERAVLRWKLNCVSGIIVQTPSMKQAVLRLAKGAFDDSSIQVLPFELKLTPTTPVYGRKFDFIYPASGEPHKNHAVLIEAWVQLKKNGSRPSLALTLGERDEKLWNHIRSVSDGFGLDVTNLGNVPHERVGEIYGSANAVIYPSMLESLGLPLLEAAKCGTPVIAGELDYVRDVCSPVQTFDPRSAISIARAILRYLQGIEDLTPVQEPEAFWEALAARSK